jgi:hypothetical protein
MSKVKRIWMEEIPSISEKITQTSHGFSVGNIIRHNGSIYIKAQADTNVNAEAIGIIESVNGNDFVVSYSGRISGLTGLTAGSLYYLSDSVAGGFTSAVQTIVRPIFVATSTTSGIVINTRGQGFQGFTGPQGLTGSGFQGNTGFQGFSGPQGFDGFQGLTGSGFQGTTGSTGFQGFTGPQGLTGSGFQGATGSTGFQGFTGSGFQGSTGFQGTTLEYDAVTDPFIMVLR